MQLYMKSDLSGLMPVSARITEASVIVGNYSPALLTGEEIFKMFIVCVTAFKHCNTAL